MTDKEKLDWIYAHCNITLYPPAPAYPIEHNPHANQDSRIRIEAYRESAEIRKIYKEGDWITGVGHYSAGCSQVFTGGGGHYHPFSFLDDFDPTHFRLATKDEIVESTPHLNTIPTKAIDVV